MNYYASASSSSDNEDSSIISDDGISIINDNIAVRSSSYDTNNNNMSSYQFNTNTNSMHHRRSAVNTSSNNITTSSTTPNTTTRRRIIQQSSSIASSSIQRNKILNRKQFYTKTNKNIQNNNIFHWKILKYSISIVLISYIYYTYNTHCEEYELIQEAEIYLPPEDQIYEQTKVHPFLLLDEEDIYYRELKDDIDTSVIQHYKERLVRTIPSNSPNFALPSYDQFQNRFHNVKSSVETPETKTASNNKEQSSFCNKFTKSAYKENPNLYTNPLTNSSIVILSGILSSLGFHLAHTLQNECNVSKIIGIDPMLPNTYAHRIQNINTLNNLYKSITNLHVPIYQSFLGVKPIVTGLDLNRFDYTHVIHVTPFIGYNNHKNTTGMNNNIMNIRQNGIAMEQLLHSLRKKRKASFVYVSGVKDMQIHSLLNVLQNTYKSLHQISTINIQLGRIYGPHVPKPNDGMHMLDTVYVKDAVDAIITASQLYITNTSSVHTNTIPIQSGNVVSQSSHEIIPISSNNILHWNVNTMLDKGSMQTYYYKQIISNPYDANVINNLPNLKSNNNILASLYMNPLPCSSECSILPKECVQTSFDDVIPTSQRVTKNCDIVLYTSGVSTDPVESLSFTSNEDDDDINEYSRYKICKVFYVRDDSPILTIPPILTFLNYSTSEQFHKEKYKYNGKLQIDDWIIIFLPPVLNINGDTMLKISPGKFMSDRVKYAMYYELNFNVIPKKMDVLFLISLMSRKARKERTIKVDTITTSDENNNNNALKQNIILPPEPNRKSVLLAAKRKNISYNTKSIRQIIKLRNKTTLSKTLDTQRQFYEKIATLFNRQYWKNPNDATYKYTMKHFIRSYWILHSLKIDQGRLLRCDWLSEHFSWNYFSHQHDDGVDEISLAYVLSKREMERKLFLNLLDDDELQSFESSLSDITTTSTTTTSSNMKYPKSNIIDKYTDRKEWESLFTNGQYFDYHKNGINIDSSNSNYRDVQAMMEKEYYNSNETQIAIRIISDESMITARKKWKLAMDKKKKNDNSKTILTGALNLDEE